MPITRVLDVLDRSRMDFSGSEWQIVCGFLVDSLGVFSINGNRFDFLLDVGACHRLTRPLEVELQVLLKLFVEQLCLGIRLIAHFDLLKDGDLIGSSPLRSFDETVHLNCPVVDFVFLAKVDPCSKAGADHLNIPDRKFAVDLCTYIHALTVLRPPAIPVSDYVIVESGCNQAAL